MKRKEHGFTLVELLAVIVVLAIIMVIAIPAVMGVTSQAKKESFFLYAQSLQSKAITKYTQELEYNTSNADCAVYDIGTDLGLSDTGDYEGWVMVSRQRTSSQTGGRNTVSIKFSEPRGLQYVRYCVTKDSTCHPDTTFHIQDESTEATVSQNLEEGYRLCANYEYADGNQLRTSSTTCKTYAEGTSANDSYTYAITLSMKDKDYAVEAASISEDMSEEEFTSKMYTSSKLPDDRNAFVVFQPSCNGGVTGVAKGDTEELTTIVTTAPTTNREDKTTIVTTSTTTRREDITSIVTTSTTTRREDITTIVTTSTTTRREENTTILTTTTTTGTGENTTIVTTEPTTTIDINDSTLLLNTLNVQGYDIGFTPFKFYYDLTVPNNVTSLSISASTTTPITTWNVTGHENLAEGRNVVIVSLFNTETGATSMYRIIVNRYTSPISSITTAPTNAPVEWDPDSGMPDPTLEESNAALQMLSISGYPFKFQADVYEYTLQTRGEEKLNIVAKAQSDKAIVMVRGQENLQNGSEITVSVKSANGYYSKEYKIKVTFEEETSNSTKLVRGIAVGTGVALLAALLVIQFTKKKASKMIGEVMDKEEQTFNPDNTNNNNNNTPGGM